jgi:hypothetical protein
MTTQQEHMRRHRQLMHDEGEAAIAAFLLDHPHYSKDLDQSGLDSATNWVALGHCGAEAVVFKYFCQDERQEREIYGLRHWAPTGLVPRLLHQEGKRFIVIQRIWGEFLSNQPGHQGADFTATDWDQVGTTLGQALAQLCQVPLSETAAQDFETRFYGGEKVEAYFGKILAAGRQIHDKVAAYQDESFGRSLDFIAAHLDRVFAPPRLLYNQDISNMLFAGNRFSGFFDLEMCRVGTLSVQLGSLWHTLVEFGLLPSFSRGFAAETGYDLNPDHIAGARAFYHLMVWRYLTQYGEWRGEENAELASAERATSFKDDLAYCDR